MLFLQARNNTDLNKTMMSELPTLEQAIKSKQCYVSDLEVQRAPHILFKCSVSNSYCLLALAAQSLMCSGQVF